METLRGRQIAKAHAAKQSAALVARAIAGVAAIAGHPKAFDRATREALVPLQEGLARSHPWVRDDEDERL